MNISKKSKEDKLKKIKFEILEWTFNPELCLFAISGWRRGAQRGWTNVTCMGDSIRCKTCRECTHMKLRMA